MPMHWDKMAEFPSIQVPENCEGEAQLVVSRPASYHLTAGVVFSCPGIGASTLNVVFEATTKIDRDAEESAFVNQMGPIAEVAVRQFCKKCPLRPDVTDASKPQRQLEAQASPS
jgi:hypothetical protein